MKMFWQKAVALCLCIAVSVSAMVAPASAVAIGTIVAGLELVTAAAGAVKALAECTSSVTEMVSDLKGFLKPSTPSDASMWIASSYWAAPDGHRCELASVSTLEYISQDWNANYASEVGFSTTVAKRELYDGRTFYVIRCLEVGGRRGEQNMEYYLCDGNARILCVDTTVTPTIYDGTWKSIRTLRSPYSLVSYAELYNLANAAGGKVQKSGNLYLILNSAGTQYYATPSGLAYAYMPTDESASGSDRPTDSVIEVGGDGSQNTVSVDGDNTKIDIANGVFTGLDGTLQIIDGVIYDESTKTYYIDSHDSYTTNIYNYYTYQYYINYTSITYIGYTELYDKHYEVYYQLPDGRSSADLTAEELEQLNLSVDVINYGRSADDVSLRSLYHFDGDTDDSSYWNYCTGFTWNKGASLTYMDEGTFGGSLYLDETEHDFTLTMPSGLMGDFTLQFRYYQSATAAPQTDSYLNLGSTAALKLDGANIKNGSGTTLSAMPIGSWNELALIRDSGTLFYYLNGVKIGSAANAAVFDKITFHFGSSQQTFKKLDELRILNYALQKGGASYTPTSVPHDTNLALVLPDTAKPIADEYWNVTFGNSDSEFKLDFSKGDTSSGLSYNNCSLYYLSNGLVLRPDSSCSQEDYEAALGGSLSDAQLSGLPSFRFPLSPAASNVWASGQASFLLSDGTIVDFRFVGSIGTSSASGSYWDGSSWIDMYGGERRHDIFQFNGGFICLKGGLIAVVFDPSSDLFLVAAEFRKCWVEWNPSLSAVNEAKAALTTRSTMTAEHITSITAMTPEDLATPTLAVRSDIPVTSWQIGGVRPSVPSKGQVWALVERQYITSLQIYNGRAWEACDGRIWTGSRWVPYSAYNVITLKDMSDIVDSSSPDKEYIYTETGFWDWWQRSWNTFTSKFFALFGGDSGKDCKHSYTDEIVTEATCTDPGQMRRTCSKCGESVLEEIPALGHDWNATETVPDHYELPSGTKCPDCGGTEFSSTLEDDTFTCTCGDEDCGKIWTVKGRRQYGQTTYTCSRCGETYVESNETGGGLWESLGNFLSDGVRWIGDKLTSLVESLSGLNKIFADMAEKVKEIAGGFPALFGSFLALMPQDLMAVIWFGIVGVIVLLVYKKWFG